MKHFHRYMAGLGGRLGTPTDYSLDINGSFSIVDTGNFFTVPSPSGGRGISANPDGDTVIVHTATNTALRQYDLTTAYDPSTGSYSGLERGDHNSANLGLSYFGSGFVLRKEQNIIRKASISNYGISSYASVQSFSHGQNNASGDVWGSEDGEHIYSLGANEVTHWDLSSPYDLPSRSLQGSVAVATTGNFELGLSVSPDGRWFCYTGNTASTASIRYYEMTTPHDITTAVLRKTFTINNPGTVQGFYFNFLSQRGYWQTSSSSRVYLVTYTPPA